MKTYRMSFVYFANLLIYIFCMIPAAICLVLFAPSDVKLSIIGILPDIFLVVFVVIGIAFVLHFITSRVSKRSVIVYGNQLTVYDKDGMSEFNISEITDITYNIGSDSKRHRHPSNLKLYKNNVLVMTIPYAPINLYWDLKRTQPYINYELEEKWQFKVLIIVAIVIAIVIPRLT